MARPHFSSVCFWLVLIALFSFSLNAIATTAFFDSTTVPNSETIVITGQQNDIKERALSLNHEIEYAFGNTATAKNGSIKDAWRKITFNQSGVAVITLDYDAGSDYNIELQSSCSSINYCTTQALGRYKLCLANVLAGDYFLKVSHLSGNGTYRLDPDLIPNKTANAIQTIPACSTPVSPANSVATVYLAWDTRNPNYPNGFTSTNTRINVSDKDASGNGTLLLLAKDVAAGTLDIPAKPDKSNYFIAVVEKPLLTNLSSPNQLISFSKGSPYYFDRAYTITADLPAFLLRHTGIKTSNTTPSATSFTLNQPATVYLAWDYRNKNTPAGFTSTGQSVTVSDTSASNNGTLLLLSKSYPAGNVTIPAKPDRSNYILFIVPSVINSLAPASIQKTVFFNGSTYYTDRPYTITSNLPSFLANHEGLKTSNNTLTEINLTLQKPATIYLAWDNRNKNYPSGFTSTNQTISVSDTGASGNGTLLLLSKSVNAGSVTIPKKNEKSNYFVFVVSSTELVSEYVPSTLQKTTFSKGSAYYSDRAFTITSDLPIILKNHVGFKTTNSNPSAVQLSIFGNKKSTKIKAAASEPEIDKIFFESAPRQAAFVSLPNFKTNLSATENPFYRFSIVRNLSSGYRPQLTADASGRVIAWWSSVSFGSYGSAYYSKSTDYGKTWSSPTSLSSSNRTLDASISIDNSIIHALRIEVDASGNRSLVYQKSANWGSSWSNPKTITTANYRNGFTLENALILAKNGTVHLAWLDNHDGSYANGFYTGVYYARSTDGGNTFQASKKLISTGDHFISSTGIQLSANGSTIYALWVGNSAQDGLFYNKSTDNGTTWSGPILLSDTINFRNFPPPNSFDIALDGSGNAYAAWIGLEPSLRGVFVAKSNGSTWSNPQLVTTVNASSVDIVTNNQGVHLLITGGNKVHYFFSANQSTTWDPAYYLSSIYSPSAAIQSDQANNLYAIWQEGTTSNQIKFSQKTQPSCTVNTDCGTDTNTGSLTCRDGQRSIQQRQYSCSNNQCFYADQVAVLQTCEAGCYPNDASNRCACNAGNICLDSKTLAYKNSLCTLSNQVTCEESCQSGSCVCTPRNYCSGNAIVRKNADCSTTNVQNCPWGCENAACKPEPPCTNECSSNQNQCSGTTQQQCGNYDADSCLEYPSTTTGNGNTSCDYGCSNGSCNAAPSCAAGWKCQNASTLGYQNSTCSWSQVSTCSFGCSNNQCNTGPVACSRKSDCGTDGPNDGPFCQGNTIYQEYLTYSCENPGTSQSECVVNYNSNPVRNCSNGCTDGTCNNTPTICSTDSQCGTSGFTGSNFCQNNNVYRNYQTFACNNPGSSNSSCSNSTAAQLVQTCPNGCSNGTCNAAPTTPQAGDDNYCSEQNRCSAGKGDCDNDNECQAGLKCDWDEGRDYGFNDYTDVCLKPDYGCHPGNLGSNGFCSSSCPCDAGDGSCRTDNDCKSGLKCINGRGLDFGFASTVGVCLPSSNAVFVPSENFSSPEPDGAINESKSAKTIRANKSQIKSVAIEGFGSPKAPKHFKFGDGYRITLTSHTDNHFINAPEECIPSPVIRNSKIPHVSLMVLKDGSTVPFFNLHVGQIPDETGKICYIAYESVSKACKKYCDKTPDEIFRDPPTAYPAFVPSSKLSEALDYGKNNFNWVPSLVDPFFLAVIWIVTLFIYVLAVFTSFFISPTGVVNAFGFGINGGVLIDGATIAVKAAVGIP